MPTIQEYEKTLINGRLAREDAIEKLHEIKSSISDGKQTLQSLRQEVESFQEGSKATKTVGTGVGAVGTACAVVGLGAAFFTGGASLALLGDLGLICSLTGAVVNVGTSINDSEKNKGFIKRIHEIMPSLNRMVDQLKTILNTYNETLEFLQKIYKLDNNEAWSVTNRFYNMGKNLKEGVEQMGSIGIFMMEMAMAKPRSTDTGTAVLIPLAQNMLGMVKTIPNMAPHVVPQVIQVATQELSQTIVKEGVKAGSKVSEELAEMSAKALSGEAVKSGGKMVVDTTGAVLQGVFASFSVLITIWEITSLVQSWNDVHPAVETIDQVFIKLDEVETDIQSQLDAMQQIDTMIQHELDLLDENSNRDENSSSESDSEDEDKIRVYDKSTQTMKSILQRTEIQGISSAQEHRGRPAPDLINELRQVLRTTGNDPTTFGLASYFLVIDLIHELITSYGATFKRIKEDPSCIQLDILRSFESIEFNINLRNYFRDLLMPIHSILKIPLNFIADPMDFSCIYRFRCIKCLQEFNYVGQAIEFKARYKTHTYLMFKQFMDREDRDPNVGGFLRSFFKKFSTNHVEEDVSFDYTFKSHLYKHVNETHKFEKISDVLQVDIVHRLPEHNTTSREDKLVLRSWEIYNQWFFKAMIAEGGGSRR